MVVMVVMASSVSGEEVVMVTVMVMRIIVVHYLSQSG